MVPKFRVGNLVGKGWVYPPPPPPPIRHQTTYYTTTKRRIRHVTEGAGVKTMGLQEVRSSGHGRRS